MICPSCGSSRYVPGWNGCDQCGHKSTPAEITEREETLRAIVRENRNRSREGREWAGIEEEWNDTP